MDIPTSEEILGIGDQPIRVLFVEDIDDHAEYVSTVLKHLESRMEIVVAPSVDEAIEKVLAERFDLLLSDYRIGTIDCFTLLKDLEERGIDLPVVIITGQGNEEVAAEAIRRGAEDYLIKDNVFSEPTRLLKSIVSAVHRSRLEEALRDSEEQNRTLVQNIQDGVFVLIGSELEFVNRALAEMLETKAEEMRDADFLSLFHSTQQEEMKKLLRDAWNSEKAFEGEYTLIGTVANPTIYVTIKLSKTIYKGQPALIGTIKDITERKIADQKLQETMQKLEVLSITDDLSGLFNRRHALKVAEVEVARCKRYHQPLSLVMIDVDRFKEINDKHGHICGDEVLVSVAKILKADLRESDTAARYGGDEFLLILPQADSDSASAIAERLRHRASVHNIKVQGGPSVKVSLSLGITEMRSEGDILADLIRRADNALLAAKSAGRNAVQVII